MDILNGKVKGISKIIYSFIMKKSNYFFKFLLFLKRKGRMMELDF